MIKNLLCNHLIHLYNIAMNFLVFLKNYCYILLNHTLALQHQDLWHCLLLCYLFHLQSVYGAQLLNIVPLSLLSVPVAAISYSSFHKCLCIPVIT